MLLSGEPDVFAVFPEDIMRSCGMSAGGSPASFRLDFFCGFRIIAKPCATNDAARLRAACDVEDAPTHKKSRCAVPCQWDGATLRISVCIGFSYIGSCNRHFGRPAAATLAMHLWLRSLCAALQSPLPQTGFRIRHSLALLRGCRHSAVRPFSLSLSGFVYPRRRRSHTSTPQRPMMAGMT